MRLKEYFFLMVQKLSIYHKLNKVVVFMHLKVKILKVKLFFNKKIVFLVINHLRRIRLVLWETHLN
jgi:hypothetical protein